MIKTKFILRFVGLAAATVCGINTAMAQATYTVDSGGLESFNLTIDNATYQDGLAGVLQLNYVSGTGSSFASVCSDINGTLYLGYNYTYSAPTGFSGQHGLDPTWGAGNASGLNNVANAVAAIQAAADIFYHNQSIVTGGTLDQKAGLQLAIWAALYNTVAGANSISLNGSRFGVALPSDNQTWSGSWGSTSVGTQAAINEASSLLSQVNFSDQYSGNLLIPTPENQYGLVGQEVLIDVTPVPEATTLIIGGLFLLPFAVCTFQTCSRKRKLVAA